MIVFKSFELPEPQKKECLSCAQYLGNAKPGDASPKAERAKKMSVPSTLVKVSRHLGGNGDGDHGKKIGN
ncbi:MAG: hypothetical protein M1335_06045 [Chloroflexi bacterium]|nr:hypothetical protein [Chloroflexota bacterium]